MLCSKGQHPFEMQTKKLSDFKLCSIFLNFQTWLHGKNIVAKIGN